MRNLLFSKYRISLFPVEGLRAQIRKLFVLQCPKILQTFISLVWNIFWKKCFFFRKNETHKILLLVLLQHWALMYYSHTHAIIEKWIKMSTRGNSSKSKRKTPFPISKGRWEKAWNGKWRMAINKPSDLKRSEMSAISRQVFDAKFAT